MSYKTIPDNRIFHIWKDTATGEEISVPPTFYEENGTPVAEDGTDMEYVRTS